jgi:hypothetical protein
MLADRRAVLGLALGGLGFGLWLPNSLGGGLALGTVLVIIRAVALLAAAAALAVLGLDGSKRLLPFAFGVGALASGGDLLASVRGDISFVNDAIPFLGWLLLTWYAVLHGLEPQASTRRLFGMRLGAALVGVGFAFWLVYSLDPTAWQWIPGNVVGAAGLLLAGRSLGPAEPLAAPAPPPATQAGKA